MYPGVVRYFMIFRYFRYPGVVRYFKYPGVVTYFMYPVNLDILSTQLY